MTRERATNRKLLDFKALSFDCYGTLIDWETGLWDALQPLLMRTASQTPARNEVLAAFGELEHRHESETPELKYPEILRRVHRDLARQYQLETTESLDDAFATSVQHWPAFADTAEALRLLKRHYKLIVLSNVDQDSFHASLAKLGVEFDALYLAEDIGSYKPADRNFAYLLQHASADFEVQKGDLLHVAQSLMHDHQCANRHGIANAWIDRQRLSESGDWGATKPLDHWPDLDFQFFTMREFADAVRAEEMM